MVVNVNLKGFAILMVLYYYFFYIEAKSYHKLNDLLEKHDLGIEKKIAENNLVYLKNKGYIELIENADELISCDVKISNSGIELIINNAILISKLSKTNNHLKKSNNMWNLIIQDLSTNNKSPLDYKKSFGEKISSVTVEKGVDMVLNSLASYLRLLLNIPTDG